MAPKENLSDSEKLDFIYKKINKKSMGVFTYILIIFIVIFYLYYINLTLSMSSEAYGKKSSGISILKNIFDK